MVIFSHREQNLHMNRKRWFPFYAILLRRRGVAAGTGSPKRETLAGGGGLCSGA
jgi:hypothetical protein